MQTEIDIFKVLDFIRDNAAKYAQAKAERCYLEEYRKSKKALCMIEAEKRGIATAAAQEREAYADKEYVSLLDGLQAAIEKEENLRWLLEGARLKADAWRTMEANKRVEAKTI